MHTNISRCFFFINLLTNAVPFGFFRAQNSTYINVIENKLATTNPRKCHIVLAHLALLLPISHILNFRLWFVKLLLRLFVFVFKAHKYLLVFWLKGCSNLIILLHGFPFKPIILILLCFSCYGVKGVRNKTILIVYTLIMSHVCFCITIFRNGRLSKSFLRTHTIFKCNYK